MKRAVTVAATLAGLYFSVGALLHLVIFPEEEPPQWAYPRPGFKIETPTGEHILMLRSGIETGGELAQFQLDVDAGGHVAFEHIHPYNEESFQVVEGSLIAIIDGKEEVVSAGETLVVPRGTPHQLFNRGDTPARAIAEIRPADRPIESLFMVQIAGLEFKPSFIQMMLFRQRYQWTYPTSPPPAVQRTLAFLLAPTARLMGYKSVYPELTARFQQPDP